MKYVLSRYTQILELQDSVAVANGMLLQRTVFPPEVGGMLRFFSGAGLTAEEFAGKSEHKELAMKLFRVFQTRGYIVPSGADEAENLSRFFGTTQAEPENDVHHRSPSMLSLDALKAVPADGELKELRIALVGGCVMEFLIDHLKDAALKQGFKAEVSAFWIDGPDVFERAIQQSRPEMVVYQPATNSLLNPLWNMMAMFSPSERRSYLERTKATLSANLEKLSKHLGNRLGLVHNLAALQVSPFGRSGFRLECHFREILYELNLHIERSIRDNPNLVLVDEEMISAKIGLSRLFDDLLFPFGHHGGLPDLRIESPNQRPLISRIFAQEYIDCLRMWKGTGRIKCVVCDLDGTLWPGVAAEEGFDWVGRDTTSRWIHMGIHQALRILKQRGVLLATCSKNSLASTLDSWREAAAQARQMIGPDEFVLHKINWSAKSDNIRAIASELGIAPDSILFIDDNPVEREEVRRSLPEVRLLGEKLAAVREYLLTDPDLDVNACTPEASRRSEMVQGQLAREAARKAASEPGEFLKSLGIRLSLTRENGSKHLERMAELVSRTNQFNTTLIRYDAASLRCLATGNDSSLYSLHVSDRFTDYGLVGVIALKAGEIELFVLSCRVIGLEVSLPFLVEVIQRSNVAHHRPTGRVVTGPRNEPCRDVYLKAGFEPAADGRFVLQDPSRLYRVNPEIYSVRWSDSSDEPVAA